MMGKVKRKSGKWEEKINMDNKATLLGDKCN